MRSVGICGEPATGKTTMMREVLQRLLTGTCNSWEKGKHGTLEYLQCENLFVLGRYEGADFDGTDRLSMAVIKDAEAFIATLTDADVVIFEGDRLFCARFLGFLLKQGESLFIQLYGSKETMWERWKERSQKGIQQAEEFVKGRRTKYANLRTQFPFIRCMVNNNLMDQEAIVRKITEFVTPF